MGLPEAMGARAHHRIHGAPEWPDTAKGFIDSLDDETAARLDAFIEHLRIFGNRMQGKFVSKLAEDIFELRVKHFDCIFRVLFFYQPGMLTVITSGFWKKTQETPLAELARAEDLRRL